VFGSQKFAVLRETKEKEREREKADVTEFCQQVSRREVADFELKMYHCDDE